MKQLLLQKDGRVLSVLLNEDDKAADVGCFDQREAMVGKIVIGRVKNIARNLEAAFVDVGYDQNAYLPASDINSNTVFTKKIGKKLVCQDEEILVMISKEPIKTKPVTVTTVLSVAGRYVAVTADGTGKLFFSKKIGDADFKDKILAAFEEKDIRPYSVIIRTNALEGSAEAIKEEAFFLIGKLAGIRKQAVYLPAGTVMYRPLPDWLTRVRDVRSDSLSEIITDDEDIFSLLKEHALSLFSKETKITLYTDKNYTLVKKYSIESLLRELFSERVWLKSGGYLVIQYTEALTVIDVNSGKSVSGKDLRMAAFKINLEAAMEAARQIRLRNLSGIILIDFINMNDDDLKHELLSRLSEYLSIDPVRTVVMGMTRLQLVEITRQKQRKPIYQTDALIFFSSDGKIRRLS